jgi:hypothetical protein
MGYFDHVLTSGLPPIVLDMNLGGALGALALLHAVLLAIVCAWKTGPTRRIMPRRRAGSHHTPRIRRPSKTAARPITLGRAIRLTMGPRK